MDSAAQLALVLNEMAVLEVAVAAYYDACARRDPSHADFWTDLKAQEDLHASHLRKMAQLVTQHPDDFQQGAPASVATVRVLIATVQGHTSNLLNGGLSRRQALAIACDLEASFFEARLDRLAVTSNLAYETLAADIMRDTQNHSATLKALADEAEARHQARHANPQ